VTRSDGEKRRLADDDDADLLDVGAPVLVDRANGEVPRNGLPEASLSGRGTAQELVVAEPDRSRPGAEIRPITARLSARVTAFALRGRAG